MKITTGKRSKEALLGPRALRFTPTKTRVLPALSASRGKNKLVSVDRFVDEIEIKSRLLLPNPEIPSALIFSAALTLALPQCKGNARPKLVSVGLFVSEITVQDIRVQAERPAPKTTGPRVLVFTKEHELPFPVRLSR